MTTPGNGPRTERELRKEAYTMALYVAVCLLAALTAVAEDLETGHVEVLGLVWGTTLGLAIAHWFAFRVSARLVAQGGLDAHDVKISLAQVTGAVAVAVLATVPVALLPVSSELDVARLLIAGFIAVVGFQVARGNGATTFRAGVYSLGTLAVAVTVAIAKNVLSGH